VNYRPYSFKRLNRAQVLVRVLDHNFIQVDGLILVGGLWPLLTESDHACCEIFLEGSVVQFEDSKVEVAFFHGRGLSFG
jgi:hypothetical protein